MLTNISGRKMISTEEEIRLKELMAVIYSQKSGKGLKEVFGRIEGLQYLVNGSKPTENIEPNKVGLWQCLQNFSNNIDVAFGKIIKYLQELGIIEIKPDEKIQDTTSHNPVANDVVLLNTYNKYGIKVVKEDITSLGEKKGLGLIIKIKDHQDPFLIWSKPNIMVLHKFLAKVDQKYRDKLETDKDYYINLLVPDQFIFELVSFARQKGYREIYINIESNNIFVNLHNPKEATLTEHTKVRILSNWRKNYKKGYKITRNPIMIFFHGMLDKPADSGL